MPRHVAASSSPPHPQDAAFFSLSFIAVRRFFCPKQGPERLNIASVPRLAAFTAKKIRRLSTPEAGTKGLEVTGSCEPRLVSCQLPGEIVE